MERKLREILYEVVPAFDHDPGDRSERRHAVEVLGRRFGGALYGCRPAIERSFGQLVGFGGVLEPLPSWVRRCRVRLWIRAKQAINAARIQAHGRLQTAT